MTITMSGDGTIYENGQKVGHIHVGSAVRELSEIMAANRYIGSIVDDWVASVGALMALYADGLSWDEVVPCAVDEIREARGLDREVRP